MTEGTRAPGSLTLGEVGQRLAELRNRADLTLVQVANQLRSRDLKIDASGLSRLERGQRARVSEDLANAILDCYLASPAERTEILGLLGTDTAPTGRPRPKLWLRHADLLTPMQFEGYLKQERQAAAIWNWEPFIIPGLLQTPDYARAVIEGLRPELTPTAVRGLVDIRVDRQHKVYDGALTDFRALIGEEALLSTIQDTAVMHGQLQCLLDESTRPTVDIRILPRNTGCHPGMAGPFVHMRFPKTTSSAVWVETMATSIYLDHPHETTRYASAFKGLWQRALSPDETRALITRTSKEQHA
ncbi:helix-turn-helix domain-containing protein [Streptomyces sp. NPDC001407]|uniref:helix-turn-helix domain-containing protein n=1 Tax=Streptomyces sp. NPDC001407 TaxID=3364573 RepID=UPI0036D029D6